jgi:hypothetical protein
MDRTATVARTLKGKDNVNRLRVPAYGVVGLCVAIGDKTSKSYLPKGAPAPADAGGSDDFHFAPEAEQIEIRYEVNNPFAVVEGARLLLFSRYEKDALWTLDLATLGADWLKHGKHVVKWDGRIPKVEAEQAGTSTDDGWKHDLTTIDPNKSIAAFPDGYVTLEHTPYKFKLTLTSGEQKVAGNPAIGWTYFHILIKGIELELGPEEIVPATAVDDDRHKQDKAVRKKIEDDGGLPADGATRKVILISNLYKTNLNQMNDNTAFNRYRTLWRHGPNIPILAKVRLLDSNDGEIKLDEAEKGAVALGNVKFLWDWEDADEDVDGVQSAAKAKTFIKDAINYYKDGTDTTRAAKNHTYPKGDNCHVDRGGKRGPDFVPLFPTQTGYDPKDALDAGKFPFKVHSATGGTGPKKRRWASYSQGWTRGALKGKTGVVFQPARMGGDDYKLTVYLAYDRSKKDEWVLDAKDEPLTSPDAIKASTGKFQVWREIHIARYVRKTGALGDFFSGSLAGVQAHFDMAYVAVEDKMGGSDHSYVFSDHRLASGTTPDYNALCRARLTGTGNAMFTQNLATSATANHAAEDSMIKVRSYADFVRRLHIRAHTGVAAAANDFTGPPGVAPADLGTAPVGGWPVNAKTTRLRATRTLLRNNSMETEVKWVNVLDNILFGIGEDLASDFQLVTGSKNGVAKAAPEGVVTMEFNYTNTGLRDWIAAGNASRFWYGAAIDPTDADAEHCVIMFWQAGTDRFSHEYGHHVFLPHARYPAGNVPDGAQANRHDDTDDGCLMSYSGTRPGFCGLCQLRLRGWDATKLDKVSAKNKKP